jgi:hypothetical protein
MAKSKRVKSVKTSCNKSGVTKKNFPFIHALCKLNDEERKGVVKYLNKEGREAIYECVANCIYNPDIPKLKKIEIRKELGSRSKVYKYLAKPRNNAKRKKQLLNQPQTGKGLGVILGSVLPLLLSLFTGSKSS